VTYHRRITHHRDPAYRHSSHVIAVSVPWRPAICVKRTRRVM
jgi:hypothetical protein